MELVVRKRLGFTMVELLLVIITIGVIGIVALPQFTDFRKEARIAAASEFISHIRSALDSKKTQMVVRCGAGLNDWPDLNSIIVNDITEGGAPGAACTATQIPDPQDRQYLSSNEILIPLNPNTNLTTAVNCSCTDPCDTTCSSTVGYCYNQSTGIFWGLGLVDNCSARGPAGTSSSSDTSGSSSSASSDSSSSDTSSSCTPGVTFAFDNNNNCTDTCTLGLVAYSDCSSSSACDPTTTDGAGSGIDPSDGVCKACGWNNCINGCIFYAQTTDCSVCGNCSSSSSGCADPGNCGAMTWDPNACQCSCPNSGVFEVNSDYPSGNCYPQGTCSDSGGGCTNAGGTWNVEGCACNCPGGESWDGSNCNAASSSSSSGGSYCTWDGNNCYAYADDGSGGMIGSGQSGAQYCCGCSDNRSNPPINGIQAACDYYNNNGYSSSSCGTSYSWDGSNCNILDCNGNNQGTTDWSNCGQTSSNSSSSTGCVPSNNGYEGQFGCYSDSQCVSSTDQCACDGTCGSGGSSSNPNCVSDGNAYTLNNAYGTCYTDSNCTNVMGSEGQTQFYNGGDNGQGSCYCSEQTFSAGGCAWTSNSGNVSPTNCGCNPNPGDCVASGSYFTQYQYGSCYTDSGCSNSIDPCNCNGSCSSSSAPVYGCMTEGAINFNPAATVDDGSCQFPVYGCMDPNASNYNSAATNDDGSCQYSSSSSSCGTSDSWDGSNCNIMDCNGNNLGTTDWSNCGQTSSSSCGNSYSWDGSNCNIMDCNGNNLGTTDPSNCGM